MLARPRVNSTPRAAIFGEERVSILNDQVRVEEFVGVLVRIRRRRFGAAKVNPVLIPRDDRVDRWVLPCAQTIEAKFVLVVGESRRQVGVKNWGAIWRIMAAQRYHAVAIFQRDSRSPFHAPVLICRSSRTLPRVRSSVVGVANDCRIQTVIPHAVLRRAPPSTRAAPEAATRRALWRGGWPRRPAAFGDRRGRCRRAAPVRAAQQPTRTERQ